MKNFDKMKKIDFVKLREEMMEEGIWIEHDDDEFEDEDKFYEDIRKDFIEEINKK